MSGANLAPSEICRAPAFLREQGRWDSKANIYGLPVLAHRDGRTSFLVADRLTERQLKGDTRPGESPILSVVMVGIRLPSRTTRITRTQTGVATSERIRVMAKGYMVQPENAAAIPSLLDTFELSYKFLGGNSIDITTRLYEYGIEFHDPDHAVFIPDTATATGREEFESETKAALLDATPLPAELVADIVSCIDHRSQPDSIHPGFQPDNLLIFLTFPTTADERESMQSSLQREATRCLEKRARSPAKRKEEKHPVLEV